MGAPSPPARTTTKWQARSATRRRVELGHGLRIPVVHDAAAEGSRWVGATATINDVGTGAHYNRMADPTTSVPSITGVWTYNIPVLIYLYLYGCIPYQ
jgi:hypothetical protein